MRGRFQIGLVLLLAVLLYSGCKKGGASSKSPQKRLTDAESIEDPVDRAKEYISIAKAFGQLEDSSSEKKSLRLAAEAADAIDVDRRAADRTRAHIDLAQAWHATGDSRGCQDAYDRAEVSLKQVEDIANKTEYLVDLALLKIKAGEKDDAESDLKDAEVASEEIQDSQFRINMLAWMTVGYKRLDDTDNAARIMQLARDVAESEDKVSNKARRLSQVAREQISSLEDEEAGIKTFQEAVEFAQKIADNDYQKASALVQIADDYVAIKQIDKAKALLDEAQELAYGKVELDPVAKEIDRVRRKYN